MTTIEAPPEAGWTIRWRDTTYTENDLTGAHLSVLALISGNDDYQALAIDPRHGHQRLMMMICAFVTVDACTDTDDVDEVATKIAQAQKLVASASADEILGSLTA